jgi:hypothetical protein
VIDWVQNLVEQVKELNGSIKHFSNVVGKMWHYITHPLEVGLIIWNETVEYSFYICLMIFIIGTIIYLIGYKKGSKWARVSIFSYVAIQIFDMVSR